MKRKYKDPVVKRSFTKIKASTVRAAVITTMQGEASHVARQIRAILVFLKKLLPLNMLCRWWWNCHMIRNIAILFWPWWWNHNRRRSSVGFTGWQDHNRWRSSFSISKLWLY
ncbi:hypothetical protein V8G54_006641 [Vigna mungo]|uniref:Uncharacterized protein n=1 Tax=Vigna mungo TaxID=3915 RepID=A0AAQ3P073_VIGMU